ncbi:MAG TPA: hypothetical protein DCY13_23255 [Verrucomicrobiales bacterium]|nr:hypothetical protein [Verrucomicrobiales bacterium]
MKKQHQAVRAGTIAKVVALSLFLGGAGVGYVFQKSQIYSLSQQRNARDRTIADLEQEQRDLIASLEKITSTPVLEKRINDLKLGLAKPGLRQVRTLAEPSIHPTPRAIELVGPRWSQTMKEH